MIKLKKGIKLRAKQNLVVGDRYDYQTLWNFLYKNIEGVEITIKDIHHNGNSITIEEDGGRYYYNPAFFNLFITNEK